RRARWPPGGVGRPRPPPPPPPTPCPGRPARAPGGPMPPQNVVLVDGLRTPFARGGGGKLVAPRLDEAGATLLRALLDRNPKVRDTPIEDVGLGNGSRRREFVLLAAVPPPAGLPLAAGSLP